MVCAGEVWIFLPRSSKRTPVNELGFQFKGVSRVETQLWDLEFWGNIDHLSIEAAAVSAFGAVVCL